MSYIKAPLQGFLLIILSLIAPLLVLFALPFIKWDEKESTGPQRTNPPVPTIMGDFPDWLAWFRTPDQRLPGDTGIVEIRDMLAINGKWYTSWVWAGSRNALMGLAVWMGNQTDGYIPENIEGYWESEDVYGKVWIYTKTFGKVKFMTGYTAYAMLDGTFRSAPILTLKRV